MKRQLLASTALVAVAAAVDAGAAAAQDGVPIKLEVKGFFDSVVGTVWGQDEGARGVGNRVRVDEINDAEIHFVGRAVLDNGVTLRAVVELEGDGDGVPAPFSTAGSGTTGTDVIDEAYLDIRTPFGQLILGSTDSAAYLGTTGYIGSWATQVGQNLTLDLSNWFAAAGNRYTPDGPLASVTLRNLADDADKITYITPRVFGLQLGVSYMPNTEQDANTSPATTDTAYHDGIAFAVNFDRKLDVVQVGLAFGYMHWRAPEAVAGLPDGSDAWVAGARLSYRGIDLSGGYRNTAGLRDWSSNLGVTGVTSLSGHRWEVGARYTWGRNAVSGVWGHGVQEGLVANPNEQRLSAGSFAYRRTLASGVVWYANLFHARFTGEDDGSSTDDNSGWALATGVRLTF